MLNDMVTACDALSVSLGWRGDKQKGMELSMDHIKSKGGKFEMGNVQAFMHRNFVNYILNGEDPNLPILRDILTFVQSADEVFWPTIFLNSPLCRDTARLSHDRQFFLYFWPNNPAKTGEKKLDLAGKRCRKANFSDPDWFCGLSPFWLKEQDIARISMYRDTLFVRKADWTHSAPVLQQIDSWIQNKRGPPPLITTSTTGRSGSGSSTSSVILKLESHYKSCFVVLSSRPPQFQWRIGGCKEQGSKIIPVCTGPVKLKEVIKGGKGGGTLLMYSSNGVGGQEAICLLKSQRFPTLCLTTRYPTYAPGVDVGFGPCESFKENQVWKLSGRYIRHAAAVSERSYGVHRGKQRNGLCLARSRDQHALSLEMCDSLLQNKLNYLRIKAVSSSH